MSERNTPKRLPAEAHGAASHEPVMKEEMVAALSPRDGGLYVDGTFGAGGHARAILQSADCSLFAIDRDPHAVRLGVSLLADWRGRFRLVEGRFSRLEELLRRHEVHAVDGVVLDVGVSSMQLDDAERGFSFLQDGPLDMRMSGGGDRAMDVVNRRSEAELARVIAVYGEERQARKVAQAIVSARAKQPLKRTGELAQLVRDALRVRSGARHPATRVFQALRIVVNDELQELSLGLRAAERVLKPGGRLVVVSFHSLEDRLVKQFLQARSRSAEPGAGVSRHRPLPAERAAAAARHTSPRPSFRLLHRGARRPQREEVLRNRRARSARLRAAERTAAPVFAETERQVASC